MKKSLNKILNDLKVELNVLNKRAQEYPEEMDFPLYMFDCGKACGYSDIIQKLEEHLHVK